MVNKNEALIEIRKYLRENYNLTKVQLGALIKKEDGSELTDKAITSAENGTKINISLIHKNLVEIFQELEISDSLIVRHLEELGAQCGRDTSIRLAESYLINRFSESKSIRIYNTFIPGIDKLMKAIKARAEETKLDVKIVLMSPKSRYLHARATELGISAREMQEKILHCRDAIKDAGFESSVKFYSGLPSFPLYMVDDDIYAGFFLVDSLAVKAPQRKFEKRSVDGYNLYVQFKNIWTASTKSDKLAANDFITPRHEKIQAFLDLFPGAEKNLSPDIYHQYIDPVVGTYKFARYRLQSQNFPKSERPILSGGITIYPYSDAVGGAIFKDFVPHPDFKENDNANIYTGTIIPYLSYLFLFADDPAASYPVLAGLQRPLEGWSDPGKKILTGLVMKRHPDRSLFAAKAVFKKIDEIDEFSAFQSSDDPHESYRKSLQGSELLLTKEEFHEQFELADTVEESLLYISNEPQKSANCVDGVLEISPHDVVGN